MIPHFGPLELTIILVIVVMFFGAGKLPELFGAVGRGVRDFRRNANVDAQTEQDEPAVKSPAKLITDASADPK